MGHSEVVSRRPNAMTAHSVGVEYEMMRPIRLVMVVFTVVCAGYLWRKRVSVEREFSPGASHVGS